MVYDGHMSVTQALPSPRPKRGARAFSDSEEWAIYGRIVHGNESKEAVAVEYGVSGRTIENVLRRRKQAIAKGKTPAMTVAEADTTCPENPEHAQLDDSSTSGDSAQRGAKSSSKES